MDIARISFVLLFLSGTCLADRTADQYRKAFESIDDDWMDQISDHTEVLTHSLRQPPCLEVWFAKAGSLLDKIAGPAAAENCDWEVDLSEGLEVELPHLGSLRDITRVIRADAERNMILGNSDLVADRIEMLYRISAHVGPPTLISSLLASAILMEANVLLDDAISKGMIQPAHAQQILRSMKGLDPEDPLGMTAGLESEQMFAMIVIDDFYEEIGSDGPIVEEADREAMVRTATEMHLPPGDYEWLFAGKAAVKSLFERYYTELLTIWKNRSTNDVEAESLKLEQRVMAGEFSQLAMLLAVNLSKAMQRVMEVEEQIQELLPRLQMLSDGQTTAGVPENAASIYARAIELAQSSKDDWRRNAIVRDQVINELYLAQLAKTCSFPEPEDVPRAIDEDKLLWTAPVIPWWLPSMDQFITEFVSISDQERESDRLENALANLISAINIIQHLIQCSNLSAAVVAANRISLILDRIRSMEQAGLSPDDAARLLAALQDIPTADPFGIQAASRRSFQRLDHHLADLAARDLLPSHELKSNPEHLLYLTAWLRDLPAATSLDETYFGVECDWPDGESAMACPPFNQGAIDAAATDGTQATEAWTFKVNMPIESASDICSTNPQQLVDEARKQLIEMRRSLRQLASG
ncbi:MAG: hypothetical protein CMJ39_12145 [Phycisphaerae bacterium]|nr:hypothetical protein [Phycisphaerae bacterium]